MKKLIMFVLCITLSHCVSSQRLLAEGNGGSSSEGGGNGIGCKVIHSVHGSPYYVGYVAIRFNGAADPTVELFNSYDETRGATTPLATTTCKDIDPANPYGAVKCDIGTVTVGDETFSFEFEAHGLAHAALVGAMSLKQGSTHWADLILSCQDHLGADQ